MSKTAVVLLLIPLSALADGGLAIGDHIFIYGRLQECEDFLQIIDLAVVSEDGEATFASGFKIKAKGLDGEAIASAMADAIGKETGRRPRSLSARIVRVEERDVARALMNEHRLKGVWCDLPPDRTTPQEFNRRVAFEFPPNRALELTLDPAALFAGAKSTSASSAAQLGR